jgi:hypothetical protein
MEVIILPEEADQTFWIRSYDDGITEVELWTHLVKYKNLGKGDIIAFAYENGAAHQEIYFDVVKNYDADLKSITSNIEFTPKFNKDICEYSVITTYKTSAIEIGAEAVDDSASVEIQNKQLQIGNNTITIIVTAEDGVAKKTYNLHVHRKNNEARLSNMKHSQGAMVPSFSRNHYDYKLTVGKKDPLLEITGVAIDSNATVTHPGRFYVKDTTVVVRVVSEDKTEVREYRIDIDVLGDNSYLQYLRVEDYTITPDFQPWNMNYNVTIPASESQIKILALAQDTKASVEGDAGYRYVTGNVQKFVVTVTSEDRLHHTDYIINLTKDTNTTGISHPINNPATERIKVYGMDGRLLYETDRVNGKTVLPGRLSNNILIVRGSSGWAQKVIN